MSNQKLSSTSWKSNMNQTMAYVKNETASIAHELGLEQQYMSSWKQVPELLKSFSQKNSTPAIFLKNLDNATYSLRERLRWTTKMAGCMAMQKIKESQRKGPLEKLTKRCLYPDKPMEDITHTPEA